MLYTIFALRMALKAKGKLGLYAYVTLGAFEVSLLINFLIGIIKACGLRVSEESLQLSAIVS